jgi:hypothetical protein
VPKAALGIRVRGPFPLLDDSVKVQLADGSLKSTEGSMHCLIDLLDLHDEKIETHIQVFEVSRLPVAAASPYILLVGRDLQYELRIDIQHDGQLRRADNEKDTEQRLPSVDTEYERLPSVATEYDNLYIPYLDDSTVMKTDKHVYILQDTGIIEDSSTSVNKTTTKKHDFSPRDATSIHWKRIPGSDSFVLAN